MKTNVKMKTKMMKMMKMKMMKMKVKMKKLTMTQGNMKAGFHQVLPSPKAQSISSMKIV